MHIPMLSNFIDGLKLFFASKRLRWLFVVFFLSVLYISALGYAGLGLSQDPVIGPTVIFLMTVSGGVWPMFFFLIALASIFGLKRFVASDESYAKSLLLLFPWVFLSGLSIILPLVVAPALAILFLVTLLFGVAFIGWISFQAYFATRTSVTYAKVADGHVTRLERVLSYVSYLFCYVLVAGAVVYVLVLTSAPVATKAFVILGSLFALGFNFVNGLVMARHRNKPTLVNVALIGLFISFYSAYFIYNAGTATSGFQLVEWLITLFFVLYTMSGVGRALSSRAHLDTRLKMSPDSAAAVTFFLASGYYFASLLIPIIYPNPDFGASVSGIIKLFLFPFIALIMEFLYLRKVGRPSPPAEAVVTPPESEIQPDVKPEEPPQTNEDLGGKEQEPAGDSKV